MIIYINKNGEIKDVNTTTDASLIPINLSDESNLFRGWSVAKICCYKVEMKDGKVISCTPYVDSRIIEHIDELGKATESNTSDITDTQLAVAETYESTLTTGATVTDIQLAMTELYEMMLGGM